VASSRKAMYGQLIDLGSRLEVFQEAVELAPLSRVVVVQRSHASGPHGWCTLCVGRQLVCRFFASRAPRKDFA
jgi:hypothetical protein